MWSGTKLDDEEVENKSDVSSAYSKTPEQSDDNDDVFPPSRVKDFVENEISDRDDNILDSNVNNAANNYKLKMSKLVSQVPNTNVNLPKVPRLSIRKETAFTIEGLTNKNQSINMTNIVIQHEINFGDQCALIIRASPDGKLWGIGLSGGVVKLYAIDTENSQKSIYTLSTDSEQLPCTDIQFSPSLDNSSGERKNFLLCSYASGYIRLWHFHGMSKTRLLREWKEPRFDLITRSLSTKDQTNQIMACSMSKDRQRFVTGGDDCVIRVYQFTSVQPVLMCQPCSSMTERVSGHTMRITALMYHPLGTTDQTYSHIYISASWDNTIQIWDDRYQTSIWYYFGPHVCGTDGIDIDPVTNTILTSSWQKDAPEIQVWQFNHRATEYTGSELMMDERERLYFEKPRAEFFTPPGTPESMGYVSRWCNNGNTIIYGGSNNNVLKVLNRSSFDAIATMYNLPKSVYSVASVTDNVDKKKLRIGVCSETSVYILLVDKPK